MKHKSVKKLIAFALAMVMTMCMPAAAFATDEGSDTHQATIIYDETLYTVEVSDGTSDTWTTVPESGYVFESNSECSLRITYLTSTETAKIYVDGVETQDVSASKMWKTVLSKDTVISIAEKAVKVGTAGLTKFDFGTSWEFYYPEGYYSSGNTPVIPYGCDYKIGIRVLPGYLNSPVKVFCEYTHPASQGTHSDADIRTPSYSDPDQGIYVYDLKSVASINSFRVGSNINAVGTVVANLVGDEYTVTFYKDPGETYTSQKVTANKTVDKPKNPTKEGYQFLGWYTDESGTQKYDFTSKVTGDMNLYASWEELKLVTYHLYDDQIQKQYVESGDEAENIQPKREGYRFDGWYTDQDCTQAYNFETSSVNENLDLYAKWTKVCTITYHIDGTNTNTKTVIPGGKAENMTPSKDGYTFGGWYTNQAYTTAYDFETSSVDEDLDLYAKWMRNLTECSVTALTSKVYTGSAISPAVTITDNGTKLIAGTDYTVAYSGNKAVGKATVKITGIGNYTGTVTKYFSIIPKATKIKSGKALSGKKIKITWTKQSGATSYILYRSTSASKNYKAVKTLSSSKSSYTNTGLKAKKYYYYKIRVVKKVNGVNYYSNLSGYKKVKAKK